MVVWLYYCIIVLLLSSWIIALYCFAGGDVAADTADSFDENMRKRQPSRPVSPPHLTCMVTKGMGAKGMGTKGMGTKGMGTVVVLMVVCRWWSLLF